jgi:hypothetical protein
MTRRPFLNNLLKTLRTLAAARSVIFISCIMLVSTLRVHAQSLAEPPDWQGFERSVRDGKIGAADGMAALDSWSRKLEKTFPPEGYGKDKFFPLADHGNTHIGGSSGEGYRPKGYRFLDGNAHKGHPAQDIFILDANRDGLEDRAGTRAKVLALADGVVLSTFDGWENRRELRGGNYIWIYHPALRIFSYYAHLRDVMVGVGDRVRGGEQIATLGRSGQNASLPRSPTHLHLMLLEVDGMHPIDPYPLLIQAPGGK